MFGIASTTIPAMVAAGAHASIPSAECPLRLGPLLAGTGCLGLRLFYQSHRDLGAFWSVTLQVRENHRHITHGIYRSVRHPTYAEYMARTERLVPGVW